MLLHSTIPLVAKVLKSITTKLVKTLMVKLCHPDIVLMTIFAAGEEKYPHYWRCKWNLTQGYLIKLLLLLFSNKYSKHRPLLCIMRFWQFWSVLGSGFSVSLNYGLIEAEYSAFMDNLQMGKVTAFSQNYISKQGHGGEKNYILCLLPHHWWCGPGRETFV